MNKIIWEQSRNQSIKELDPLQSSWMLLNSLFIQWAIVIRWHKELETPLPPKCTSKIGSSKPLALSVLLNGE
jgi:hypothetical protein